MKKELKEKIGQDSQEKPCNHFMVWNIQGGYSYYRCYKCNYIDGEKTFKDFLAKSRQEFAEERIKEDEKIKRHKGYKELLAEKIATDSSYTIFKSGFSFDGSGLRKNRNGKRVKNGDIEI